MSSCPCFAQLPTVLINRPNPLFIRSRSDILVAFARRARSPHRRALVSCAEHMQSSHISSDDQLAGISPEDKPPGVASDEAVLDSLAQSGKSSLRDIGGAVQDDLESVSATTQEFADAMIAEETQALLAKFDESQVKLLETVNSERQVIANEIKRIEELTEELRNGKAGKDEQSPREKVLAIASGLFLIAAVLYAWTGFVDGDSTALRNAGLDAVAAAAAFFLSNRKSQSDE